MHGLGLQRVIFLSVFIAVLTAACGAPTVVRGGRSMGSPASGTVPDVARLVCDKSGTTLLTPKVRAQHDGVHISVENRQKVDPALVVQFEGKLTSASAPPGMSLHIEPLPVGTVETGCFRSFPRNGDGPDLKPLTVIDPRGFYVSTGMQCGLGGMTTRVLDYTAGASGPKGGAVSLTRRLLHQSLQHRDLIERAGYPKAQRPIVRVVRGGKVVAVVSYLGKANGRWLPDEVSTCSSFTSPE